MFKAVIFHSASGFGVRFDEQKLPEGSIVYGMLAATASGTQEILIPPEFESVDEEENFTQVVQKARDILALATYTAIDIGEH